MSITTTLARLLWMPASSSVNWSASLLIEDADDGQDQDALADLEHRSGQLPDRVLLLADDSFSLPDEAHGHGVGDPVGGRLVGVQDPVQQLEVLRASRTATGPGHRGGSRTMPTTS